MKKVLFSLPLLAFMLSAFGQDTTQRIHTQAEYLQKSRSQKTAGWLLLGGGVGMVAAGAATYKIELDFGALFGAPPSSSHVDNTGSNLLMLGGLGAIAGSIISFVSSNHNERRAAGLSFTNERVPLLQQNGLALKTQPTLRLKIRL